METKEQASAYAQANFAESNSLFLKKLFESYPVSNETKILDVGCGDGEIPIAIYKRKNSHITALDGSSLMLNELTRKMSINKINNIKVVCQKYEDNDFEEKSFDLVISNSVLHHVKSPINFWEMSLNLIKHNGRIIVMDLFRPTDEKYLLNILNQYGGASHVLKKDFENSLRAAYTIQEVEDQLSQAQGKDQQRRQNGKLHCGLNCDAWCGRPHHNKPKRGPRICP